MGNVSTHEQGSSTQLVIGGSTALALLATYLLVRSDKQALGPDGKPLPKAEGYSSFWGHTFTVARNAHRLYDFMVDNAQRLDGKPFTINVSGRSVMVVATSPETLDDVLNKQDHIFDRGPLAHENFEDFWGNGIFNVDGNAWYVQRKTASHLFSMQNMKNTMHEVIREKSEQLQEALSVYSDRQTEFSMKALIMHYTSDVFVKISLLTDLNSIRKGVAGERPHDFIKAFSELSRIARTHTTSPLWLWKAKRFLGIGSEKELARNKKIVDDFCYEIIDNAIRTRNEAFEQKDKNTPPPKDLVSLYLDSKLRTLEKGEAYEADPQVIRDMVINFIFAGKDTTSVSMTWFIIEMNKNPDVAHKIRDELRAKVPYIFSEQGQILNMEDLPKLTYLEAVIRENLRLHAAAPTDARSAKHDTTLSDGTFIPTNVYVMISLYAAGHLKSVWGDDAEEFKPERWLEADGELKTVSPAKFSAFALGSHRCLGERFAYMEMKITLATILSNFDIKMLGDPKDVTYEKAITLSVAGDLMCKVERVA